MRKNKKLRVISSFLAILFVLQNVTMVASAEDDSSLSIADDVSCIQMNNVLTNTSDIYQDAKPDVEESDLVDFQLNTSSSYIPTSYDLRDDGDVTSVKNQGEEGLCWAYSTLGSCESNILKQDLSYPEEWNTNGELSLSVNHLAYFPFTNDERRDEFTAGDYIGAEGKGKSGGNSSIAVAALASGVGADITGIDNVKSDTSYSEYERYSSYFRLNSSQYLSNASSEDAIMNVKSWIMENGAVDVSFHYDSAYYTYNDDNTAYYQNVYSTKTSNHEVSIVGWDDDFAISNFSSKGGAPASPGAWLIKNSWGTEKTDGYMWISYYDPSLSSFTQFIMEPSTTSDNIIQYDSAACVNAYSFASAANVFTADSSETLKSVGFYLYNDMSSAIFADIKIYLLNDNFKTPVEGTLATELKGTYANTGYKKIDLSKTINLDKGQKYSIVVSFKYNSASGKNAYCAIEENCNSQFYDFCYTSKAGQTYIVNKGEWIDAYGHTGKYGELGNLPVKAYTDENTSDDFDAAKSNLVNALSVLQEQDANYASSAPYELASVIETTTSLAKSTQMLKNASNCIYAYLENLGKISYPQYDIENIGLGNVNKDSNVNSSDAVMILREYASRLTGASTTFTYAQEKYSDVNYDSKTDSKDAVFVLKYYAASLAGIYKGSMEDYMDEFLKGTDKN